MIIKSPKSNSDRRRIQKLYLVKEAFDFLLLDESKRSGVRSDIIKNDYNLISLISEMTK